MHCASVIALLVRGYIALSLGMTGGDLRRSSDETNVLLPNKLIQYGEVSSSWLDVNYLLMHVNTCTHVYHYTHITYAHVYSHTTHIHVHTQSTQPHTHTHTDCSVKCDEPKS